MSKLSTDQLPAASIYHFKTRWRLLSTLTTPLQLLMVILGASMIYFGASLTMSQLDANLSELLTLTRMLVSLVMLSLVPLGLFNLSANAYIIILQVGRALKSYVAVSADGLEVNLWPYTHVQCEWVDIERDKINSPWGGTKFLIHIKRSVPLPLGRFGNFIPPIGNWVRRSSAMKDRFSPNSFEGYPHGGLADELKRYAPHLFESSPDR